MKTVTYYLLLFVLNCSCVCAQNYHAIQGSSVAGSLSVANNPASIIEMPEAWDVVPLAMQLKNSTNAFTLLRYSYLSSPQTSQYRINGGNYSRYINNNFNVHLLNARFALGRTQAIAFGLNLRGYTHVTSGNYNYRDTVKSLRGFFLINEANRTLNAQAKSNTWYELWGTYSRTVWNSEFDRLNAGITVRVTGGVSGVLAKLDNAGVQRTVRNNKIGYVIGSGSGSYAYSANLDEWKKTNAAAQNIGNLLSSARKSVAVDLGMEYIIRPQTITSFDDVDTYYDYTWKFGISLLDLGRNRYDYGSQSRLADQFKSSISDSLLLRKTAAVHSVRAFNDSLATLINNLHPLTGTFFINNPARLVVNLDRCFSTHFFVNADLSINLSFFGAHDAPVVNEMNLLSVTPRWENRHFGFYLPVLYNTEHQLWVGGAFRAGPLLLGVHNLSSLTAQNKTQNGGGYLAFIIRPGRHLHQSKNKKWTCPAF